jgi:hypothetical protein
MLNINMSKANLCITNYKNRDLISKTHGKNVKCYFCQESTHYHIELGWVIPTQKEDACTRMSLGTMNASGIGMTLKEKNIKNRDNIIDSRNVQHAEGILRGLTGW